MPKLPPPATEPVVLTTPKVTFTVTETSVAFSWEAVEHASGYEYRLQKASETVKEAKVDAETLQALVDVPKGSEIYILKVRALGTGDYTDSEWSRNTVLTPEPKPTNIEFADAVLEKYLLSMQPSIDLDGDGRSPSRRPPPSRRSMPVTNMRRMLRPITPSRTSPDWSTSPRSNGSTSNTTV